MVNISPGPKTKKLLVQIPCLNEEENIAKVIQSIPRKIDGCNEVKVLVIDDHSTDQTVSRAIAAGADFVIYKSNRKGLAHSFQIGKAFFLAKGFDILVNTDGDNQYFQERIPQLVTPIVEGYSDLVVGDRKTKELEHFPFLKKRLQALGSFVVSLAAGTRVSDAASGFRAYSRIAIAKIFVTTRFSYAMETVIQAGTKGLRISNVPTGSKKVNRRSRLFRNDFEHVRKSSFAIVRSFLMYRPVSVFFGFSLTLLFLGAIPLLRYLILLSSGSAGEHIQSLILGSLLITISILSAVLGLVAELSRIHRQLFEDEVSFARLHDNQDLDVTLSFFSSSLVYERDLVGIRTRARKKPIR